MMEKEMANLPDNAKIWIFQSQRPLTLQIEKEILNRTRRFFENWAAHGAQLTAYSYLYYHHFLIIVVNEQTQKATGCSIDTFIKEIQSIERELQIQLLDRSQIAFLEQEKIIFHDFSSVPQKIKNGELNSEFEVFDNTLTTLGDWKKKWIQPLSQSWLKKYLDPKKP